MTAIFYAVRNKKTGAYLSHDGTPTLDLDDMYTPQSLVEAEAYRLLAREPKKYVVVKFELTWPESEIETE